MVDTKYDLYSVLVHHGYLGSGHYISYIWDHDAESWFEMNDNVAKKVDPSHVHGQVAYVLFYKRRQEREKEKWTGLEKLHLSEKKASPRNSPSRASPKSPPRSSPRSRPTSPRSPSRLALPFTASDTESDASDVDIETVNSSSDEANYVPRVTRSGRSSFV
jgi:hypothetical protein